MANTTTSIKNWYMKLPYLAAKMFQDCRLTENNFSGFFGTWVLIMLIFDEFKTKHGDIRYSKLKKEVRQFMSLTTMFDKVVFCDKLFYSFKLCEKKLDYRIQPVFEFSKLKVEDFRSIVQAISQEDMDELHELSPHRIRDEDIQAWHPNDENFLPSQKVSSCATNEVGSEVSLKENSEVNGGVTPAQTRAHIYKNKNKNKEKDKNKSEFFKNSDERENEKRESERNFSNQPSNQVTKKSYINIDEEIDVEKFVNELRADSPEMKAIWNRCIESTVLEGLFRYFKILFLSKIKSQGKDRQKGFSTRRNIMMYIDNILTTPKYYQRVMYQIAEYIENNIIFGFVYDYIDDDGRRYINHPDKGVVYLPNDFPRRPGLGYYLNDDLTGWEERIEQRFLKSYFYYPEEKKDD